ncbi:hypothetical protein [Paraclostridium bifermentans]|uniref:hypothetical protein n=1 Tax=Paraclostridium bifermentans TaxID=1490 RepID=UPI001C7FD22A|nr:hypothetical protein [Paraclostridium bifermentans]GIM32239.1 hypothetical protein PAGU1678_15090 [Paraclostridium bifermentans subsp. muricolitidis]
MKIINNILKAIVYLMNSIGIFYFICAAIISYGYDEYGCYIKDSIMLSILAILYIYLTYLFYKNTFLNEENIFEIIILIIISIIMLVWMFIDMNNISSFAPTFSDTLIFYCPYVILLVSVKFNKLYMKKLKD